LNKRHNLGYYHNMRQETPRTYKYKKANVILTVGIDKHGRLYSFYEKYGQTVARDMFVRMPSEVALAKQGWERYHE
jgi:hypothetical protein